MGGALLISVTMTDDLMKLGLLSPVWIPRFGCLDTLVDTLARGCGRSPAVLRERRGLRVELARQRPVNHGRRPPQLENRVDDDANRVAQCKPHRDIR